MTPSDATELDALVVGAGFCGLGAGARLRRSPGVRFAILEQGAGVGAFWKGTYDRVRLHSPDHDLPQDGGLRRSLPLLLARDEIVSYFEAYAERHGLGPHLRLDTRVERVRELSGSHPWHVETSRGVLRARHLVVATSVNRVPKRATIAGVESFGGRALHSAEYRNATPFRGRSVLVVGSGNSGAEIALDLLEGGARAVSMWVRGPRHFIPLAPTLTLYRTFRALGQMSEKKLAATHALTRGTPAFDREVRLRDLPMRALSADLSRFGIRKPATGPVHGIAYEHRIPVMDVGAIARIRDGGIRVIDGNVRAIRGFTPAGVAFSAGEERFDDVVLATGYEPGLEQLLGETELLGSEHGQAHWPLTDGRCRSRVRPSAWFPGFDPTPLGGISLGRWGWEVGDRIAAEVEAPR
jgi:cation diffusion facilitator CzcD-associated flavoprotein CzcO